MKVDLEKLKLSVSPITGEVYVGVTNKSGVKWLHKVDVTNQFNGAVLHKFLGTAKKKTTEKIINLQKMSELIKQKENLNLN